MKPLMTIGMAVANDFDGAYFSLLALKMYHAEVMNECELILVDNQPKVAGGERMLRPLMGNIAAGTAGVQYIPLPDKTGTSQSRNAVFENAHGEYTLCMDSHVLVQPGALEKLIAYYRTHPGTSDLYSGPMLYDNLVNVETHFDDVWRSEMYGVWGKAWSCPCVKEPGHDESKPFLMFTPRDVPGSPVTEYWALKIGKHLVSKCERCGRVLPISIPHSNHIAILSQAGYIPAEAFPDSFPPFEIPAMGLGLFTCRREAWLGFNPNFRGFGGEEIYIHEKYRQAGHKNICLPFLRWGHRFGRANGVPYRLVKYDKVRNYVLGFQELGWDLTPIHDHFVKSGAVPQAEWDFLLQDPVKHELHLAHKQFAPDQPIPGETAPVMQQQSQHLQHQIQPQNPSGQPLPPKETLNSLESLLQWFTGLPRDLNEHMPRLAELAKQCKHVTEFTERRESTVALLAGRPEKLVSYNMETDLVLNWLKDQYPEMTLEARRSIQVPQIEETDFLFLDSAHDMDGLMSELLAYAPFVRRWIALHDTVVYGQAGPGGGPGMVPAMQQFLKMNPEWFIYSHTLRQYGLTVLGRRPEDRPVEKVHAWPPGKGPGSELKSILAGLGINPSPSCDCNGMAVQMDQWGVEGCRAQRETIVQRIKDNQGRWGWQESFKNTATAGWKALTSGLAFKLSWKDPIPSLVDLAIHNAEQAEAEEAKLALEGPKDGDR